MECVQRPTQTFLCLLSASQLVLPRQQELVLVTPQSNRKSLYSLEKLRHMAMRDFLRVTKGSLLCRVRVKLLLTSLWPRFPQGPLRSQESVELERNCQGSYCQDVRSGFLSLDSKEDWKAWVLFAFLPLLLCLFHFRKRMVLAMAWPGVGYLGW